MKYCKKCNSNVEVENHHVHCRFMDNQKGFGMTIYLCKKCHTILGLIIPSIIWKYVPEKDKLKVIKEVESFTYEYCKDTKNKKIIDWDDDIREINRCKQCDYELDPEDYNEGYCSNCDSALIKNGDEDDKCN